MNRINMVILDSDTMFLNQLSRYLLDKTDKFTISSFSDAEKFKEYSGYSKIDLLLFTEDYIDCIDMKSKVTRILMTESYKKESEDYYIINKYQKAENFLKDVLMIYAEDTGNNSAILSSGKDSYLIGFYSPVGGSGKTTLAVALAKTLADSGAKVLYLNLERISSLAGIFNDQSNKSFSDILLAAKGNENIQLKILSNTIQNNTSKIYYINPPESAVEYSEVTDDEMMKIITELKDMSEFDYVIIDFLGEFNKRVMDILNICKKIIFTTIPGELAKQKVQLFIKEMKLLGNEKSILKKTAFVTNRVQNGEDGSFIEYDVMNMTIDENEKYADIRKILKSSEYNDDIGRLIALIRD